VHSRYILTLKRNDEPNTLTTAISTTSATVSSTTTISTIIELVREAKQSSDQQFPGVFSDHLPTAVAITSTSTVTTRIVRHLKLLFSLNYQPYYHQLFAVGNKCNFMQSATKACSMPACHGRMENSFVIVAGNETYGQRKTYGGTLFVAHARAFESNGHGPSVHKLEKSLPS
jgi:hypothetical protein